MTAAIGDADCTYVEEISREVHVLSEETLKQLRKGPLVKFTTGCDDNE